MFMPTKTRSEPRLRNRVAEGIKDAIGGSQLGSALLSGPADPIEGMDESGAVPIEVIPFGG